MINNDMTLEHIARDADIDIREIVWRSYDKLGLTPTEDDILDSRQELYQALLLHHGMERYDHIGKLKTWLIRWSDRLVRSKIRVHFDRKYGSQYRPWADPEYRQRHGPGRRQWPWPVSILVHDSLIENREHNTRQDCDHEILHELWGRVGDDTLRVRATNATRSSLSAMARCGYFTATQKTAREMGLLSASDSTSAYYPWVDTYDSQTLSQEMLHG